MVLSIRNVKVQHDTVNHDNNSSVPSVTRIFLIILSHTDQLHNPDNIFLDERASGEHHRIYKHNSPVSCYNTQVIKYICLKREFTLYLALACKAVWHLRIGEDEYHGQCCLWCVLEQCPVFTLLCSHWSWSQLSQSQSVDVTSRVKTWLTSLSGRINIVNFRFLSFRWTNDEN